MSITSKYIFLSGANTNFMDTDLLISDGLYGNVSLTGQELQFVGTTGVDLVFVRPGVSVDFTGSGSGADRAYMTGNFAAYSASLSGSNLILTRGVGATAETLKISKATTTAASDRIVFADGTVNTLDLFNYVTDQNRATPTGIARPTPSGETSLSPNLPASLSANVKAVILDTTGETIASQRPGMDLVVAGSSGVDRVYVKAGTKVDASGLSGGADYVYMTGNYADYQKTVVGSKITFSRTVAEGTEQVVMIAGTGASNDWAVFADGRVQTNTLKSALATNPNVALSAVTGFVADGTPGLSDIQSVAIDTTATSTTTNSYLRAGDTVVVSVAMKKPVDVAGTGTPKISLNIGGTLVDANFDSALSSGTINLSTLKFKVVLPAGSSTALNDTNGLSINANAITLGSATIKLTGTSTAAKLTHALVADNTSYLIDNVPPTATPNAALTTDTAAGSATNLDGITRLGNITAPTNTEAEAKVEYRITKDNGIPGAWSRSYTAPVTDGTADGDYKVEVRQTDKAGNVGTVQTLNFTLDTQATSALSFVGLSANATVQVNQVINGQGAEAGASVELLSDGVSVAQTTAANDGSFYFTTPTPAIAGDHTFTLRYTDKAGNISTPAASTPVTWSANAAAVAPDQLTHIALSAATDSGVNPADGITNIAVATLTGTGALSGATIEVTATTQSDSPTTTVLPTVTALADGSWSLTLSGANLLAANTNFTVRQKASGAADWSPTSASYAVVFDNTAPISAPTLILDASSDTAARDNITSSRSLLLTGTAEARAYVDLFDNGSKIATVQADSAGAWQTTLSGVSETRHNYTARQYDLAGNTSVTSAVTVVTVDATVAVPGAATLDPSSDTGTLGDKSTTVTTPKLTGTGAEAGATIQVFDGSNSTPVATATVQPDGSWSANTSALSVGVHALRVSQTDVAGNTSTLSVATNIYITAPVSLSAPSSPVLTAATDSGVSNTDGITNATSLTFSGTGAVAGGTVEIWQGSSKLGTVNTASAGAWSYTTTLPEAAGQTLKARVLDASGNASSFSADTTFTIDRTAPTSALTLGALSSADDTGRLQTDGITQQNYPTVSGSGASAGARVQIFNGNGTTALATFTADGSGNFSGKVALPADATYNLRAAEVDAAGNIGPRSVAPIALTLDTNAAAAPAITSSLSSLAGNPSISGTAEANAYVELLVGASTTAVAAGYANASGVWTLQYPQTTAGSYDLSVRQTDAAGNVSAASVAASTTITNATPNAVLPVQLGAPTFKAGEDTGVLGDDLTSKTTPVLVISGVDASITSANVATNLKVYDGATLVSGNFVAGSASGSWEFTPTTALTNATRYSFNATQTVDGNTSVASAALGVSIDNAVLAPTVTHFGQVRYVLLKQTGATTNQLWVNEVEVYANGTNIALNKTVTAGNAGQSTYPATGITNGNLTRTGSNGYASATNTSDNWVQIDLGGFYAIDSVKVYALSSAAADLPNTANVDVFASGQALSSYTYAQLAAGSGGAIKVGGTGTTAVYTTALNAPVVLQATLSQPLISGTGEAGATVTIYDTPSGGSKTMLGTALVNSSGVWTFQATDLAGGAHSFTAMQTDIAGNTSVESAAQSLTAPTVVAPTSAPAITLLSTDDTGTGTVVVDGNTINYASDNTTSKTSVTVRGTGANFGDTIQVFADLGGGNYELRGSATVNSDGNWSLVGVTLAANASTTLVAKATNAAGSSDFSSPLVLTNDSTSPNAPTVALVAASDSGVQGDARTNIGATASTLSLSGSAEAGAAITIKAGSTTVGTATAGSDGNWSATLTNALTANVANALSVTATDKAGNASAATSYSVTHDNTAPTSTLAITSSLNSGVLPTVAGNGAEAGAFVDIYSGATLLGSVQASSTGTWSLQLSSISSAGTYNLTAKQRDAAGNVSASGTDFTLVADSEARPASLASVLPNFSLQAADDTGTAGDNITTVTTPRLTGTGAEARATIQVWEGSTLVGSTTADDSGTWTVTPNSPLSAGLHTLTATQQVGGNASPALAYNNGNGLYIAGIAPAISNPSALFGGDNSVSWVEAGAGTATLSGTSLNNATVLVSYTNAAGTVVNKTATVTNGATPNAATWTAPNLSLVDLVTLGAGNVTVSVKQTYGTLVSPLSTRTVAIESLITPVINANIAGDDTISAAELATGAITGTAVSGASVSVSFTNSSTGAVVSKSATATGGNWSVAMLTQAEAASLGAGSTAIPITVAATQTVSGVVSPATSRSITLAAMAPATPVTINSALIAVDDIINATETPTISGTAAANASVSVTLTNTVTGASVTLANATATAGGSWTTAALTAANVTTLAGDNHPLRITATQTLPSGGGVSSVTRTIAVDTVAPLAPSAPSLVADASTAVASDSGVVGDNITSVTTPTFSGRANPGATVTLYQGSTQIGTGTADASTGVWTIKSSALTANVYSITAKQADAAGNLSAASNALAVTIDTTASAPVAVLSGQVRYVLLKQTGATTNQLWVNEVEVYANGTNIALNKTVTAGTAGQGGTAYPASGITNGNLTRDGGNGYASATNTSDGWVQIDLGAFYAIDSVKVYALSSAAADLSKTANVDVFASQQALSSYTYAQLTAGTGGP